MSLQFRFAAFLMLTLAAASGMGARDAEPLRYNRDIRPILSDRCFKCHGPDKGSRKAGLRLDLPEEAYAERKKSHKHPIVPGNPEQSLIIEKISSADPDEMMPPPESKLSLTAQDKEKLRRSVSE